MEEKIIYYKDELNDEFSEAQIVPRKIDGSYKYVHKNPLWNLCAFLVQNILSMPIKLLYVKTKFGIKYVGREKLKKYKKQDILYMEIIRNHLQTLFIPSLAKLSKRNYFIVNPENVSMKGLKHYRKCLELFQFLVIKRNGTFLRNNRKQHRQTTFNYNLSGEHIYGHITQKIRPFKDVSFKYPIKYNVPAFCITNTYQKGKKDKIKIVTYIDGPFLQIKI